MKDTKEYFNQRIDCNVKNCRFQNDEDQHCTLGKILVDGSNCKNETFCDSFEEKETEE